MKRTTLPPSVAKKLLRNFALATGFLPALITSALAAGTFTWNGSGTDNNWTDGGNWAGGVSPTSDVTTIAEIAGSTQLTQNVDTAWTLQQLNFTSASSFTLGGGDLTLDYAGGANAAINAAVGGTFNQVINNNIILSGTSSDNNANIISGSGVGGNLTINGNITRTGGANVVLRGSGQASSIMGTIGAASGASTVLQIVGTGVWTLGSSNNRFSTIQVFSAGTLKNGANNALGSSSTAVLLGTVAFTLDLNGFNQTAKYIIGTNAAAEIKNTSATTSVLTVTSDTSTRLYSGKISGNISLVKTSTNSYTLGGTNTFTGTTLITGGGLILSGSATLSGTPYIAISLGAALNIAALAPGVGFTLGTNQTVGGLGTVYSGTGASSRVFTANGTLDPGGAAAGRLDFSGGTLVLGASGKYKFDLGTSSDSINMSLTTGSLDIGNGTLGFSDFTFTPGAGFAPGSYTLFNGASTFAGTLDGADLTGTVGGFASTLQLSGNNVLLSVVPEPQTNILLGVGILCVVLRFRARASRLRLV